MDTKNAFHRQTGSFRNVGDPENDEDIMELKNKNSTVLERDGMERLLFSTIKKRKIGYFGHILRGEKYVLL